MVPVTKRHMLETVRSATHCFYQGLALLALVAVVCGVTKMAGAGDGAVWGTLEFVENSAEGPAFDRCELEETLNRGKTRRSRLFFGEARADAAEGWEAIRPQSG